MADTSPPLGGPCVIRENTHVQRIRHRSKYSKEGARVPEERVVDPNQAGDEPAKQKRPNSQSNSPAKHSEMTAATHCFNEVWHVLCAPKCI